MPSHSLKSTAAFALFMALLIAGGCGEAKPELGDPNAAPEKVTNTSGDHSGWWCPEHGIPEEECSMCSSKAAKQFKADGDWCEEHDRAQSQCFKCDPKLKAKFAAQYETKYGKKPPEPTE